MQSGRAYWPEIDGLRAVAVLSVILYHLDVWPLTGGFVGVDVFFVISGYLITRLIVTEVDAGSFSFAAFYIRRMRRLFPAFFAVLAASFAMGALILSPEDLQALATSAIFSILSLSNLHFWSLVDYFDTSAKMKPLLHTWSLSVEEQFYLFWPLAIVLLSRFGRRAVPAALFVASVASLMLAEYWLSHRSEETAFFMLPTRVAEFALGAGLVWITWQPRPAVREAASLAGLALIAWSVVAYHDEMRFPGATALVPCLGAALCIQAGSVRSTGWLLRNPVSVWIGKVSYSAYLVHWPMIVFFAMYAYRQPTGVEKLTMLAATFALAYLLYRFVEEPFRRERQGSLPRAAFAGVCAVLALAITLPAYAASIDGWPSRVPPDRTIPRSDAEVSQMFGECRKGALRNPDVPRWVSRCQLFENHPSDLFIFGDSHARQYFIGLRETYRDRYNIHVLFWPACLPQIGITDFRWRRREPAACADHNRKMLKFLKKFRPSYVLVSNAIRGDQPKRLGQATQATLAKLEAMGHKVIYIGDTIRPDIYLPNCLNVPRYLIGDDFLRRRCVGNAETAKSHLAFNAAMQREMGDRFISSSAIQCPDDKCNYILDGRPLFRDDSHLSALGSRYMVDKLKPQLEKWLAEPLGALD